jgi:hypothetical protein
LPDAGGTTIGAVPWLVLQDLVFILAPLDDLFLDVRYEVKTEPRQRPDNHTFKRATS